MTKTPFNYDAKASQAFIAGNGNLLTDECGVTYALAFQWGGDASRRYIWCVVEVEDGSVLASVAWDDLTNDLRVLALEAVCNAYEALTP